MNFKQNILQTFESIKKEKFSQKLPIYDEHSVTIALLKPITQAILDNTKEIKLLAKWRKDNSFAFPSQFKVTNEGTRKWLENQLLNNPTRILFFVETVHPYSKFIGHLGLYSFNFKEKSCEIDNVVRGEMEILKGVMSRAMRTLIDWTENTLYVENLYLRVFLDNKRAVSFYKKCGFEPLEKIPLKKIEDSNSIIWSEDRKLKNADKYFLKMVYKKNR